MNLVVGVPSFYFKSGRPDALSQAVAQLSPYFQTDASTQYALSNAMMTQVAVVAKFGGGEHPRLAPHPSTSGRKSAVAVKVKTSSSSH